MTNYLLFKEYREFVETVIIPASEIVKESDKILDSLNKFIKDIEKWLNRTDAYVDTSFIETLLQYEAEYTDKSEILNIEVLQWKS